MTSRTQSGKRGGRGPRKTRNDPPAAEGGGAPLSPGKLKAPLTPAQRKHLRGLGHRIKPVVLVGKEGLSPGLLARVREELVIHELIKVKLLQNCPMDKVEAGPVLVEGSQGVLVASIGKTFLLYAPHPEEPVIRLPRALAPRED